MKAKSSYSKNSKFKSNSNSNRNSNNSRLKSTKTTKTSSGKKKRKECVRKCRKVSRNSKKRCWKCRRASCKPSKISSRLNRSKLKSMKSRRLLMRWWRPTKVFQRRLLRLRIGTSNWHKKWTTSRSTRECSSIRSRCSANSATCSSQPRVSSTMWKHAPRTAVEAGQSSSRFLWLFQLYKLEW